MSSIISYLFVFYSIFLASTIFVLAAKNLLFKKWGQVSDWTFLLITLTVTQSLSLFYAFLPVLFLVNLIACFAAIFISKRIFKSYSYAGLAFYLANYAIILVGLAWGASFISSVHASFFTKFLMVAFSPLLVIMLPGDFFQLIEMYDVLCRQKWLRPRTSLPNRAKKHSPMVSIHVPVHAEPPEIVIETLDILSKLDYNNYEVLVIDNNTDDPTLWKPVREHCKKLGDKFRFFHVENLEGAKGGALNFALKHTSPRASLVSVVDGDYHADSNFLKDLIGYFDHPNMGFVQTPNDYRGWEGNLYLTMCYWEYLIFFHTTLVSLNERDTALTVGTMCIIRKKALREAGGWSEWCVTEDSELSIRIHDKGYTSVYVGKTYGRGLIPSTFAGYRKQRYRWTAGPIQEFQHHWRHLTGLSKIPSKYSLLQRVHHLNHGLDNIILALNIPFTVLSIIEIMSLVFHKEIIRVPFELWLAATILLVANFALSWLIYKVTIKPNFWQLIGGMFAGKALQHTISYSALRTVLTGNATWNRTNKFKSSYSISAGIFSVLEELIIGTVLLGFIIFAFKLLPYSGLSLMLLIGLFYVATSYLLSAVFSIINVVVMRSKNEVEFDIPHLPLIGSFKPNLADLFLKIN